MSESSPLLKDGKPSIVQHRFSRARKSAITFIISFAGLTSPFSVGSFIPAVPYVAAELGQSVRVVNYSIGIHSLALALGILWWAPYSDLYGRRLIYLISLPLLCLGCLGTSSSRDIIQLMGFRALEAIGAASVLSLGSATISDIYSVEERGSAIGLFYGAILLGPTLAPVAGGIAATYASWRVMEYIICGMAFISFLWIFALLPETNLRTICGNDDTSSITRMSTFNPFRSLKLFTFPNISLAVLINSLTVSTTSIIIIPLSSILGPRYGLQSPAQIGACLFAIGLGNVLSAPIAGILSDRAILGGKRIPADRLKAAWLPALLFPPASLILYSLSLTSLSGTLGLTTAVLALFVNGLGVPLILTPCGIYVIDVLQDRSAEAAAINQACRFVF
ncbi:hypothetical protein M422DRAFT_785747, partial [Sphaerobolus stellatus SS14]